MKKILFVMLTILFVTMLCGLSYYEHNYTREECKVIQINDGWATIEDKCGFVWDYDCDGLKIGDIVDLKMEDNFSSAYIGDDVIKEIVKK